MNSVNMHCLNTSLMFTMTLSLHDFTNTVITTLCFAHTMFSHALDIISQVSVSRSMDTDQSYFIQSTIYHSGREAIFSYERAMSILFSDIQTDCS